MRLLRPRNNEREQFQGRCIDFHAILNQKPLESAWSVDPTRRLVYTNCEKFSRFMYLLCWLATFCESSSLRPSIFPNFLSPKGQLISEAIFWLQIYQKANQKANEIFGSISALASSKILRFLFGRFEAKENRFWD